jgi:N-acetylmuramoyl-L-alanine amidase
MTLRIVADAGHGGEDPGGPSPGSPEKTIVLAAQSLFWKAAADRGHAVFPTRVTDVFIPIPQRSRYANALGADVFVSLHANAGDRSARGPWTLHARGSVRGQALAQAIQREVAAVAGGNPSAAYPDESSWVGNRRLGVLRGTSMPAVIVEMGFMTNPADLALLQSPAHLAALTAAVVRGVEAWDAAG